MGFLAGSPVQAQATLTESWRVLGGDRSYLTTSGDTQRGLAYSAGTNHVYVASRAGTPGIYILNADTGADLNGTPTSLNMTGVTGGTFTFSTVGVGSDGAIYAANLTTNSSTSAYKIYRWANESATPTVAYSGNPLGGTNVGRFGDNYDVTGSGANTLLGPGRGNAPDPSGVVLFGTTDGVNFTPVASAPASTGNYRQGVTFGGAGEFYGKESGDTLRRGTFDSTLAYTESNSYPTANFASGNAGMDVENGQRLLAALNPGTHTLSLYDVSDTANPPVLLTSLAASGTGNTNANAAGQVAFDAAHNRIFMLDTNNGVTAFSYSVPEPGTAGLLAAGLLGLAARRRRDRA
jgi:hypothetical protein